jgi:hypothetical protein
VGLLLSLVLAAQATVSVEEVRVGDPDAGVATARDDEPVAWLTQLHAEDERTVSSLSRAFTVLTSEQSRARAIHDWLVTRLAYASKGEPQSPADVFARRTANCDGYSRLFEALARGAGLEAVTIYGLARDVAGKAQPHAWNAVKQGERWYLVDVTFDDPALGGALAGREGYRSDYFALRPDLALLDHLPADPRWLLGEQPLSRAAFLAQGPDRVTTRRRHLQVTTTVEGAQVVVKVQNPTRRYLLLRVDGERCGRVETGPLAELRCPLSATAHHLELFENDSDSGLFRTAAEWNTPARR